MKRSSDLLRNYENLDFLPEKSGFLESNFSNRVLAILHLILF